MRQVPAELAERLVPAARVFAELGFDEARIEDLTDATGIASSTLYYYFEGKQDILVFLLDDFVRRVADGVATAARSDASARERLDRVIHTQLELMAEHPHTCRVLLAELGRLGRLPDTAKAVSEAFHEPVQVLLREGAQDGSLRALPPETAASAIFGAVTLTALHYLVADQPLAADDVAEGLLAMFAEGYLPATDPGKDAVS